MKVIGITGGVGSGKSEVLKLIENMCKCIIVRSDELAKSLEAKGEICYAPLINLLGENILDDDGEIVPHKMAKAIFENGNTDILESVNNIIHPRVKERILQMIDDEKCKRTVDYFFIEAALLIEDHYDLICDELWYIYADEAVRRQRLKDTRGYSDAKIDSIMASQLDEETFRKYCINVIDNSGTIDNTRKQLNSLIL